MAKPTTIDEALAAASINIVESASEGDRQMKYKSAKELIELDQYLAAKAASAKNHFGLRMTKLIPPGTR